MPSHPRSLFQLSLGRPLAVLAAGGAAFAALPAHAQLSPALDRVSISAGVYAADPKLSATVGNAFGSVQTGDLKADNVNMPRISGDVMFGDSQGLSFDLFRYSKGYNGGLVQGYSYGPLGASVAANVNMDLKVDFAKLAYRWWFGFGNTAVGLGAGAAYYRIALDSQAYAGVAGTGFNALPGFTAVPGVVGSSSYYSRHDSEDAIAPMLEIGVRHAITPDLRLFFDGSGVWKSSGKVHGNLYNATLGVEWFPFQNVGFTLGYAVTDIDLKRNGDGLQRLRLKLNGPVASLKARF